jgi:hypothetical protein
MKLIIDIPEEAYNNIEPFLNGETIKGGINLFKTLEIIKNGTPLDDIKEEIEERIEMWGTDDDEYHDCLDIINKHIGDTE